MNGKVGALLAFSLGAVIGIVIIYKWPAIRKILIPFGKKVEKGAVISYLAVKNGISSASDHLREIAADVAPAPKSKSTL